MSSSLQEVVPTTIDVVASPVDDDSIIDDDEQQLDDNVPAFGRIMICGAFTACLDTEDTLLQIKASSSRNMHQLGSDKVDYLTTQLKAMTCSASMSSVGSINNSLSDAVDDGRDDEESGAQEKSRATAVTEPNSETTPTVRNHTSLVDEEKNKKTKQTSAERKAQIVHLKQEIEAQKAAVRKAEEAAARKARILQLKQEIEAEKAEMRRVAQLRQEIEAEKAAAPKQETTHETATTNSSDGALEQDSLWTKLALEVEKTKEMHGTPHEIDAVTQENDNEETPKHREETDEDGTKDDEEKCEECLNCMEQYLLDEVLDRANHEKNLLEERTKHNEQEEPSVDRALELKEDGETSNTMTREEKEKEEESRMALSLVDEVLSGIASSEDSGAMPEHQDRDALLESALASSSDDEEKKSSNDTSASAPSSGTVLPTENTTSPSTASTGVSDYATDILDEREEDLNLIERIRQILLLPHHRTVVFPKSPEKLSAIVEEESSSKDYDSEPSSQVMVGDDNVKTESVAEKREDQSLPEVPREDRNNLSESESPSDETLESGSIPEPKEEETREPIAERLEAKTDEKAVQQSHSNQEEVAESDRVMVEVVQVDKNKAPRLTKEAYNYMYGACPSDERETDIEKPQTDEKKSEDQDAIEMRIPPTGSSMDESFDATSTERSGLVSYQTLAKAKETAEAEDGTITTGGADKMQSFQDFTVLAATLGVGESSAEIMGLFSNLMMNNDHTPGNE